MDYYKKLIDIYENDLNIPNNTHCSECDSGYKQPLLPWQIGMHYGTERGGIFIAGKPHRGVPGIPKDSQIIDGRDVAKRLFFEESWPYWCYTKEALNEIYGSDEESWEHIVFSNVVKCSSTDGVDNTSWKCAHQCISKNQVVVKEIELLQPRKIIFFTWSMYRDLFDTIPFADPDTLIEHTSSDHRVRCGAKNLGWWHRSFVSTWNKRVDFLIVGHPERMKKSEYIEKIAQWLNKP